MKFLDSGTIYGSKSKDVKIFRYRFRVQAWFRSIYEFLRNIRVKGHIDLINSYGKYWSVWIHWE